jgi:hypothetical protein
MAHRHHRCCPEARHRYVSPLHACDVADGVLSRAIRPSRLHVCRLHAQRLARSGPSTLRAQGSAVWPLRPTPRLCRRHVRWKSRF